MDIQQLNRRDVLKGMVTVAGVALVGGAAGPPACNGPHLDAEIAIADVAINALNIIIPSVAPLTSKILKLLKDVDADAKAGNFNSAQAAFDALGTFITQLQDDAGIGINDRAKLILVTVLGAIRAIGLLVRQSMPATVKATVNARALQALDTMTSPQAVDALYQSAKMRF